MGFEVVGVNTLEVTADNAFNVSELQGYINDTSITMIRFFDGSYSISQPLIISRDNLEIVGESQSGVTLNYTGTTAGSTLKVESSAPLPLPNYTLDTAAGQGITTVRITYDAATPLDVGNTLYLFEPNDDAYLDDDNAAPIRWFDNGGQSGVTCASNSLQLCAESLG